MHLETVLESNDIETEHEVCSGGFDKWHGYRLPRQLDWFIQCAGTVRRQRRDCLRTTEGEPRSTGSAAKRKGNITNILYVFAHFT